MRLSDAISLLQEVVWGATGHMWFSSPWSWVKLQTEMKKQKVGLLFKEHLA